MGAQKIIALPQYLTTTPPLDNGCFLNVSLPEMSFSVHTLLVGTFSTKKEDFSFHMHFKSCYLDACSCSFLGSGVSRNTNHLSRFQTQHLLQVLLGKCQSFIFQFHKDVFSHSTMLTLLFYSLWTLQSTWPTRLLVQWLKKCLPSFLTSFSTLVEMRLTTLAGTRTSK